MLALAGARSNTPALGTGALGRQGCLIRQIPGMRIDYITIKYILFGKEVDG